MRSLILAFCGLLLLGSTTAFLLYVSLLSILSIVLVLVAVMFMFLFGMHVERQRRRVPEIPSDNTLPRMQAAHTLLDSNERSVTSIEARIRA